MKKDWKKYKVSKILKPIKNSIVLESETKYKLLGLRLEGRGLFVCEYKAFRTSHRLIKNCNGLTN